jgi:hypothetical protein
MPKVLVESWVIKIWRFNVHAIPGIEWHQRKTLMRRKEQEEQKGKIRDYH